MVEGSQDGGGAAGWRRGRELNQVLPLPLAGAPSQLPPPGALAPPTSLAPVHLALSTLWHESHFRTHSSPPGRLLPSGELLSSLQDPALAAAPRSSCADSPQPADAAPPRSPTASQSSPLYRGRPRALLCLPHGTVAPPRRSTRWSTQLAPSVCWAWKRSPCGFSCLRDGLGIRSEFSLSWAAGAAWTQPSTNVAAVLAINHRPLCSPAWSDTASEVSRPGSAPPPTGSTSAPGASVFSSVKWAEWHTHPGGTWGSQ